MDVDEPRSLIIAVTHDQFVFPHPVSIIRLDSSPPNPNHPHKVDSFEIDSVTHVPRPPHPFPEFYKELNLICGFVLPPATSPEDLYIFPECYGPVPGFGGALPFIIFNSTTKNCKIIKAPPYNVHLPYFAVAATMGDLIYFLTSSGVFLCYHTLFQSWDPLVPLELQLGSVNGSAVLDDSILFTINNGSPWAYNVNRKKWYAVKDSKGLCFNIIGEAVVIDNIIYALRKYSFESLVTFSINNREKDGDDLEYTCDLVMEYEVPGMGIGMEDEDTDDGPIARHLVHFGKNKFGVVWTYLHVQCFQNIQVTCIELSETKSKVTYTCVHEFKIPPNDFMSIGRCFSLPNHRKSKSNALKEGTRLTNLEDEAEAEIVTLPPELFLEKITAMQDRYTKQVGCNPFESFIGHEDTTPQVPKDVPKKSLASVVAAKSNVPTKASKSSAIIASVVAAKSNVPTKASKSSAIIASTLGEVASSGRGNTEGHSVYVRNLPPDFSLINLVESLKKFGSVKDISIHVDYGDHMSGCWFADVEFESAASKQNAVKESVITVGGCYAVIEEKRGTGLTQHRMRGGSSSGSNKAKNHGKDSGSKTTAGKKSRNGQLKKGAGIAVL